MASAGSERRCRRYPHTGEAAMALPSYGGSCNLGSASGCMCRGPRQSVTRLPHPLIFITCKGVTAHASICVFVSFEASIAWARRSQHQNNLPGSPNHVATICTGEPHRVALAKRKSVKYLLRAHAHPIACSPHPQAVGVISPPRWRQGSRDEAACRWL
jgi:hypothetical protein